MALRTHSSHSSVTGFEIRDKQLALGRWTGATYGTNRQLLNVDRPSVSDHRSDVHQWECGRFFTRQPRRPVPAFEDKHLVIHRNQYRAQLFPGTQGDRYGQTLFADLRQCRSKRIHRSIFEANTGRTRRSAPTVWSTWSSKFLPEIHTCSFAPSIRCNRAIPTAHPRERSWHRGKCHFPTKRPLWSGTTRPGPSPRCGERRPSDHPRRRCRHG
jgi:hypothetical protein